MFFSLPEGAEGLPNELQARLDEHNPFPRAEVERFCRIAAATDDTNSGASFRRMVIDVDSLLTDLRWQLGHALLVLHAFPDLEEPENEAAATSGRSGIPNKVWALLRPFIRDHHRVYYRDMMERRPGGGTVAGWILHMLVDDAVFRSIAILDRLAHLVILAAGVPAPRGRMYFRSGKFDVLERDYRMKIPRGLTDVARGENLQFLLDYRDGLAHTVRPIARAMQIPPTDSYTRDSGERVREDPIPWSAEDLAGISLLAYDVCVEVLSPTAEVCERYIALPDV